MVHYYFRRILRILCLIVVFSQQLAAQENFAPEQTPVMHEAGDWSFSISPNYVYHSYSHPRIAGGLNSMIFLGRHISLNANLAAGQGYFQCGSGILGLYVFLMGGSAVLFECGEFLAALVLMGMAFENMNFHIRVSNSSEIVPYFSLMRIKYIEEGYGWYGNAWNMNLAGGVRLNIFLSEKYFFAPYAEATRDWRFEKGGLWGINAGIHIGIYFFHK